MNIKQTFHSFLLTLQNTICSELESVDTVSFSEDIWERPGGGGGQTRVIQNGTVFEKGGVNVSEVNGTIHDDEKPMFSMLLSQHGYTDVSLDNASFYATGLSLVIHPKNPFIPTTHANYRFFELKTTTQTLWWFGGGADLTPYYLDTEDATHFHRVHKDACDKHDPSYYPTFKKKCDTYFLIKHRHETRGIGGIFFDYLNTPSQDTLLKFVKECGEAFIPAYLPIVKKHMNDAYTDQHRHWQAIRRGRYAEFNLVYDRGTLFGLKTNGRIESILMSLPPEARWEYCYDPEPGSPESELVNVLQHPNEWIV